MISLLLGSVASACMSFGPVDSFKFFPNEEVAVIVWDQKNGVEHFIRQAQFKDAKSDFAFVVPVPSTPDLDKAPDTLPGDVWKRLYSRGLRDTLGSGGGKGGAERGGSKEVEVVKQQDIGDVKAVVLKARGAGALQTWLEENKFKVPAAGRDWIEHYVKRGWQFVAFKLKPGAVSASPLIRISFATTRPFYPYRESAERKAVPHRELNLFVIAPTQVVGSFESIKPWKTSFDFSQPITSLQTPVDGKPLELDAYLEKILKRNETKLVVSHFRDNQEIRPYDEDLVFDPVF